MTDHDPQLDRDLRDMYDRIAQTPTPPGVDRITTRTLAPAPTRGFTGTVFARGFALIATVAAVALVGVTLTAHSRVAATGAASASPVATTPAPTPAPTTDDSTTHLTYSGAITAVMVDPVVTCYPLGAQPSQATMVVSGEVAGQNRVVEIVSYLGETAVIGIIDGPMGSNTGTPVPDDGIAHPSGLISPKPGWSGEPSPVVYGNATPGSDQPGATMPGVSNLDWSQGASLSVDLTNKVSATSGGIHISGRIVCPGATPIPTGASPAPGSGAQAIPSGSPPASSFPPGWQPVTVTPGLEVSPTR